MAMELLFENHTQLDEDIIHHIIEKDYKRPEKAKQYHVMTLLVGIWLHWLLFISDVWAFSRIRC